MSLRQIPGKLFKIGVLKFAEILIGGFQVVRRKNILEQSPIGPAGEGDILSGPGQAENFIKHRGKSLYPGAGGGDQGAINIKEDEPKHGREPSHHMGGRVNSQP